MKCYYERFDSLITFSGLRLGKLTAKIGLVKILQKYNFTSVDNKPIEFDSHSITLTPKEGIQLKISQRNVVT